MEASSTAVPLSRPFEMPAWKTIAGHVAAALIAMIFLGSGLWKATDPYGWAKKVEAFMVSYQYSLPLAVALGLGETLGGILILIPRFRRLGALITGGLLVVFMGYIGWNYAALQGQDCTCFPDINLPLGITISMQRSVGPEFFIGDGIMLALAGLAGWWARPSTGWRAAAVIAGAVTVFSGVSYGVAYNNLNTVTAPESIKVSGQPVSLQEGKIFLYFFNPTCPHCTAALENMGHMKFKDGVKMIALPTDDVPWLEQLWTDVKFKPPYVSDFSETAPMREVFVFEYPPYGVVIEDGKQIGLVPNFDEYPGPEPGATLKKFGVIE